MYIIILSTSIILVSLLWWYLKLPKKSINQKHVVITGGSSGIGESLAILCASKGAHVTIIARNLERLHRAKRKIEKNCIYDNQIITTVSVDVSDKDLVQKKILELETNVGSIFMLVNCAGMAICGQVEEMSAEDVKTLIDVNYLGTLYTVQTVVLLMKARREGIIVITASQAALLGIFGMSVYSSCKFALRGLAEALYMELLPYNISVTLALPPDTDTPGFKQENKNKPLETKLISGTAELVSPDEVAKTLLNDSLNGNFFSYVGFESFLLTTLCVGMTPLNSLLDLLMQVVLLGPLRIVTVVYSIMFKRIILKCHAQHAKSK